MAREPVNGDALPNGTAPESLRTADETVRERLERERGVIAWAELVRHFARGVVVRVDARVPLIDVALCLVEDDEARFRRWIDEGSVTRASDDDARDWTAREPDFLCVVAAPWVLVQELDAPSPDVPA